MHHGGFAWIYSILLQPRALGLNVNGFIDCTMEGAWLFSAKTYSLMMTSAVFNEQFIDFVCIFIFAPL